MDKTLTREDFEKLINNASIEQLAEIQTEIDRIEIARESCPVEHIILSEKQKKFLMLPQKEKFLIGANFTGKSFLLSYVAACLLLGRDYSGIMAHRIPPVRRKFAGMNITTNVWLGCMKKDKGIEVIRMNLLPILPPGSYYPINETTGVLRMKNGATLTCMSYETEPEKWESSAVDAVLFDEPPPRRCWINARSRTARRLGLLICGMTPKKDNRNTNWLYWLVVESNRGHIGVIHMTQADNPYITDEIREQFKRAYDGTEDAEQVLYGLWGMEEGLVHKSFAKEIHIIAPFELDETMRKEYKFARVADFHPAAGPVGQWFMFKKHPEPIVYQIKEYTIPEPDIITFSKDVIRITGEIRISSNLDIIDSPDAKQNKYRRNLRDEASSVGFNGLTANRDESTGIQRFEEYLKAHRFFIFSNCTATIRSIKYHRWKETIEHHDGDQADISRTVRHKDNHYVRNIHYLMLEMPVINRERYKMDFQRKSDFRRPVYTMNYQKAMNNL